MNRLEASPLSTQVPATSHQGKSPPATPADEPANKLLPRMSGGLLPAVTLRSVAGEAAATTFTPVHYEDGYAYPLLVWLHDEGQSDSDLPTLMQHISLRNYVAAAPRGDLALAAACSTGASGWCDSTDAVIDTEERVIAAIELAQNRFNVRPDRVFLAGVGAGGTAALRVGLANPDVFSGVASFDGPMPLGGRPLRSLYRSRRLPLLLSASRESRQYPQTQLCRDLRLLHTAGCHVNIRQYPGDDDLTTTMLSDLDSWMMEIVCG